MNPKPKRTLRTADIVALLDQAVPTKEIARRMGTTPQAIYEALIRDGIEHPRFRRRRKGDANA